MENYSYELKYPFPTKLPINVRDKSELIQMQYISGITALVKSIYSLLRSTENYELNFEMFDYSSEDLYKFIIRKENGDIIIDNLTDGDQITPFIDEENPEPDIETVVVDEIIKEYYYVINKITKNGQIVYDKFGTRVIAEKDRPKFYGAGLECSICGIDFESNTPVCILTPCNHVIHCSCLDGWISTGNGHDTCPICRTVIHSIETVNPLEISKLGKPANGFGKRRCSSVAGDIRYLRCLRC